jgi:hypothetical protein
MVKIVVARYNESIEWTTQFNDVAIYNKGDKLDGSYNEILLPNVGREGHTYYKYIHDNYDNLDDHTIFLQGNPFDHSPNIITNMKYIFDNMIHLKHNFLYLSEQILECNLYECPHHKGIPIADVYIKIFGNISSNFTFKFGAGAQFIVSKPCILQKPKSFYLKIVKLLEYSINPIEGFVIERFHPLIFLHNL